MQYFIWVEFTQHLGVGLGLEVRINNRYSHPVCMGRRMNAYATISDTQEISRKTGYLLHADDAPVELQLMTSHGRCTQ